MFRHSLLIILIAAFFSTNTLLAKNAIKSTAALTIKDTLWKGFVRCNLEIVGKESRLIIPKKSLPNKPWIWRARFPNYHTEIDSQLVADGFHLFYINTDNQFGSPKAMKIWDEAYQYLTKHFQLQQKVILHGHSRGGLFVYNWAKRNPDKVACIYADAPVCDFKSWPAGFGESEGHAGSWKTLKAAYGFATDAQARAFANNPIDNLTPLADANIPILHTIGLEDKIVPPEENTYLLLYKYLELGGNMMVMPCTEGAQKLEGHHYPIESPQRVVDFIKYHATNAVPSSQKIYKDVLKQVAAKTEIIELIANEGQARLLITPEWQGRILTSTHQGLSGAVNGWLNESVLASDQKIKGGVGGEDRLWIGPLGSQFSFYFQQIQPISDDNWLVPATMELEPYQLVKQTEKRVSLQKEMELVNFVGTSFRLNIERKLQILDKADIQQNLALSVPENIDYVAFESANAITNIDKKPIVKTTGLVAVWSAGMFEGSDQTTMIIPTSKIIDLDSIYQYMGPLNANRLRLHKQTILFKMDGLYRSKIGIPNHLAPPIYGCYAKDKQRLTIVQYQQTADSLYFNSTVSIQDNPYQGEVIPIYNNGRMDYAPTEEVSFFELESTSPMRPLSPHQSIHHYHRVYHFHGKEEILDKIAKQILGVRLEDCGF